MRKNESIYIEKKGFLSNLAHQDELAFRESKDHLAVEFGSEEEWLRCVASEFPKFMPFLTGSCGVKFHGRLLEIGAGAAWFSAELSKLPDVQEITATDFSPALLKEQALRVFDLLNARADKIQRMPGDFHHLELPDHHFDFVVASAVLHHAVDMSRLLGEVHRVLKPGGQFVAIREQIWPLFSFRSRSKTQARLVAAGVNERYYTLAEYRRFFAAAGFQLRTEPVSLRQGLRSRWDRAVNGLTHARYVFLATKSSPL